MKLHLLIIYALFNTIAHAQINLVPNGDFEYYISCPSNPSQINKAAPWFQPYTPGGISGSTDYYHSCNQSLVNVPGPNFGGYQHAFSGYGYANIWVASYSFGNSCEYIEVPLIDSLKQGVKYCVSFYIALGEHCHDACNLIGAYFSQDTILYSNPFYGVLPYLPQIESPANVVFIDSINWTKISGQFTALGGERFLTIGNFNRDSSFTYITVNSFGTGGAYYFIDYVSVVEGQCSTDINELEKDEVKVYPNPVTDELYLPKGYNLYEIYDLNGRKLSEGSPIDKLSVTEFHPGIYIIQLTNKSERVSLKVVKL